MQESLIQQSLYIVQSAFVFGDIAVLNLPEVFLVYREVVQR